MDLYTVALTYFYMPYDSTRRKFLQLAGATGAVALAGCSGGNSGEAQEEKITIGTSSDGSSSWTIGQAMQAEVQRQSDSITLAAERTDGFSANVGLMAGGDVDSIMLFNNMYDDAIQGKRSSEGEEYDIDQVGWQGGSHQSGEYMMVTTEDSDIEYYQDLVGRDIATFPTGTGIHPVWQDFMEGGLDIDSEEDINRLDLDFTDHASALEDGRVEACGFFTHNFGEVWSGTWQELAARNNIRPLQVHPDYEEQAAEYMGPLYEVMDYPVVADNESGFEGVEAPCIFMVVIWLIDPESPADAWYEISEILTENVDQLQEASPMVWDLDTEETFTAGIIEDYPVHPGVAEFLQDQGWWDDAWTIGGE